MQDWMWFVVWFVVALIFFIAFLMGVMPVYSVWSARKRGEAALAEAQGDQAIQIAHAHNRKEAATLNKEAEIIDAEAVAKSVEIISTSLKDNHGYLQWQWIEMMRDRDSGDTIYVPTEAGLPILEAGKRK